MNVAATAAPGIVICLVGINLAISNALKTSLLPSNAALPPSVSHVQFRTLLGGSNAIAVLQNMQGGSEGDPARVFTVWSYPALLYLGLVAGGPHV